MAKHYETEREYLVSLGLAKPGRGRFSTEAKAALQKAKESGVTFGKKADSGDDAPGNPQPPAPKGAGGAPSEAAKIREWAKTQGIKVSARGRIPSDVIAAYNGDPKPTSSRDDIRSGLAAPVPVQHRVRQVTAMYGRTEEGYKVGYSICRRCMAHITLCACSGGPLPPSIVVETIDQP